MASIASKRIKEYIESHGLKKKFVSEKTGISRSALSARLNGDTNFTCDELCKICEALNCTPNDLLLQKEE